MAKARCTPLWQPIPCPLSDIEGLESWLGDMAAQGLVPVTIGQNFARFRCSQPKAVRYRLNAKPAPETFLESAPGTPDGEERALAQECGLTAVEETPNGSSYNVQSEEQAHALLGKIMSRGIPLIKYELREPSLNEIFIEKVGESDEK